MKILYKFFEPEEGIGLVETVLALGLSIIVITSMVSLSVFTLRSTTSSKLLLQSSKLANEELELVRAYRDAHDWDTFVAMMGTCEGPATCHVTTGGGLGVSTSAETVNVGGTTNVTRYFYASDAGGGGSIDSGDNLIGISVVLSWTLGGETKYAHNYTELSNWRDN
jgi:hypothetical protein